MSGDNSVLVEHNPSPMKLEVLAVDAWPSVTEPVSVHERCYQHTEINHIIRGRAEIIRDDGPTVVIGDGDLVTFMPGARCRWNITETMDRRYRSG